jgi:hypothetical protein
MTHDLTITDVRKAWWALTQPYWEKNEGRERIVTAVRLHPLSIMDLRCDPSDQARWAWSADGTLNLPEQARLPLIPDRNVEVGEIRFEWEDES